jgi:hypothetical protein
MGPTSAVTTFLEVSLARGGVKGGGTSDLKVGRQRTTTLEGLEPRCVYFPFYHLIGQDPEMFPQSAV